MQYKEIKIQFREKEDREKFLQFLELYEIENATGYSVSLYDENGSGEDPVTLYYPGSGKEIYQELKQIMQSLAIENYTVQEQWIEDRDYWEEYKKNFQPFFIKNFLILPSWHKDTYNIPPDAIPVILEPGLAFGTGTHITTQLMLEWINDLDIENKVVLDAGCGSGILTIAALRKKASKVFAFDIEELAIESTKRNLLYNFAEEFLDQHVSLFHGSWDEESLLSQSYNVILANLTLPVFLKYQNYIRLYRTKYFVVSGIHESQLPEILEIFSTFPDYKITAREEWVAIAFFC